MSQDDRDDSNGGGGMSAAPVWPYKLIHANDGQH